MKILGVVEKFLHLLVGAKNRLYNFNLIKPVKLNIPVISVGNISFGGAGKTPTVIFLAQEFSKTKNVTVICKSYKAQLLSPSEVNCDETNAAQIYGDEACLIKSKLKNCNVWSGPDKTKTAITCLSQKPDLIILDDGFSHRKLHRQFELLLVDATQGFQTYLREPLSELKRADAVLITKSNLVDRLQIESLKNTILKFNPKLLHSLYESKSETVLNVNLESPLFIFCGLAQPDSFINGLIKKGFFIAHKILLADHFQYSEKKECEILNKYFLLKKQYPNLEIVTTEKDRVKLTHKKLINELNTADHFIFIEESEKGDLFEKIRSSF